mgnify:CR=1 FL=1
MFLKRILPICLMAVLMFASCTSHTYDDVESDGTSPPIPEEVTYQDTKAIFDNNCVQCHGNPPINGATNGLTNYDQVTDAVLNRGLIDRISRSEGANGLMPPGGPRLPQSVIELIEQWEADGLLEE